ncbi:MAG: hypothetical protein KBA33_08085 [Cloacibacterium sp.]|nr:hypothetical protein [Cloacibacterium sp.]
MGFPIAITPPNTEQLARGAAVNILYRFGMQTAKPFKISDTIGSNGNPVFNEIADIEGKPWLTTLGLEYGGKTFEFIECIVTINQEKNIITTALQGRDGTIKEYISDGDYSITVDAAINNYQEISIPPLTPYSMPIEFTNSSFEYPLEKLKELQSFLKTPDSLNIQCDLLEVFKVRSVVVKSFNLQQETHSNRQSIQIQLLSDEPYEIKLKQDENVKVV